LSFCFAIARLAAAILGTRFLRAPAFLGGFLICFRASFKRVKAFAPACAFALVLRGARLPAVTDLRALLRLDLPADFFGPAAILDGAPWKNACFGHRADHSSV
jgi:hypothetical protein